MNVIYLALLSCLRATTSFVHKSEARLHVESMVGGTAVVVGERTYADSIQINDWHHCSGGILNNRYVITAAHCFIDSETNKFENDEYIVVAGVTKAHNKKEQYRVMREVAKIYIPREYNPMIPRRIFQNRKNPDIAVLELTTDLGLNQFITNVALPPNVRPYSTYKNHQAVVCSYGHNWINMRHDEHTNEEVEVCSGSHCYELRFSEVNILSNMACRNFFDGIMDGQLCGKMRQPSPASPEGLCTGDSGSPLVIRNTIIGIVSRSPHGCREDLEPAKYTRVTSCTAFITSAMNGVRTADMRLAKYEVIACGRRCHKKVLVEQ